MKNIMTIATVVLSLLLMTSCDKETLLPDPNGGNDKPLIMYTQTGAVTDKVLAKLSYKDKSIDFNFYGDMDASGEISKVKAISIVKTNTTDTVYNFTLDDNMRVKTIFLTFRGTNDTTLLKYSYQDTTTILSGYFINPTNKAATLREQIVLKNSDYSLISHSTYRLSVNNQTQLRLAKDAVIATLGGLLLTVKTSVVILGVTLSPTVIALAGISLIIYSLYDVYSMNITLIDGVKALLDAFISDSNASESSATPTTLPPNPSNQLSSINTANSLNSDWNWCPCAASLSYTVFPSNYSTVFGSYSDVTKIKDVLGDIPRPNCAGGGTASAIKTRFFLLRPNSSVDFYFSTTPHSCVGGIGDNKTYHFTCN